MTNTQAKKAMPKFHGDDHVAREEFDEGELSEMDMDVNGLYDSESDDEDQEEAMRRDLRERQKIARAQMEKDTADELREFHEKLVEEKEKALQAAREEAHRTRDERESMERNHCPDRMEATDKDREDLEQNEDEIEKQRSEDCEKAMNSDEERAANDRSDHLNYIAQVRFDEECKHRKAIAEEKALAEEMRKKDEAENLEKLKKQKEQEIVRAYVVRQQAEEQAQIDAEFEQQEKEKKTRMAKRRGSVLNSVKDGTENRRNQAETRQENSRRTKVSMRRNNNLFMETMVERKPDEELDENNYVSSSDEFNSDTPLMGQEDEDGYISFEDLGSNGEGAYGKKGVRL